MKMIVITEKPSQAQDVRRAVGNRYGTIYPALGHLLELKEPEEVDPDWKTWSYDLLRPADGLFPWKQNRTQGRPEKFKAIRDACKTTDHVILATDPDREGQLIGDEILQFIGFKGKVSRVVFAAPDETTISKAFADQRPNAEFASMFAAARARQQADQIFNLTLTRSATKTWGAPGTGAVGIGRVKTPTLAIVVARDLKIENFRAETYYVVDAQVNQGDVTVTLRHAPVPDERIRDRAAAQQLANAVAGLSAPLSVKRERKTDKPPKLFDLPALQKECAKRFKWSVTKTLEVLQSLYEKGLATYPRSEVRYLPESQIADVPVILKGLLALDLFRDLAPIGEPVIRKGKSGHFCDACLAGVSHTAVVPNVNTIDKVEAGRAGLSPDARSLYDLIASSYVAAMMPDHTYLQTEATLTVSADGKPVTFSGSENVTQEPGWQKVAAFAPKARDGQDFSGLVDGPGGAIVSAAPEEQKTKPPARFNEGTLVEAMQEAWKFVDDDDPRFGTLKERLKESKGIGTPATRAAIIEGLFQQGFLRDLRDDEARSFSVQQKKNAVVSTDRGRALIAELTEHAPSLVQPGLTAVWEMQLDDVQSGKETMEGVIDRISAEAARIAGQMRMASKTARPLPGGKASGPPRGKGGNRKFNGSKGRGRKRSSGKA